MIDILILHSLMQKSYTMYSIKKHIEAVFSAFITPSFGAINPALRRLEEKECIKSKKIDGKSVVYIPKITEKEYLDALRAKNILPFITVM